MSHGKMNVIMSGGPRILIFVMTYLFVYLYASASKPHAVNSTVWLTS